MRAFLKVLRVVSAVFLSLVSASFSTPSQAASVDILPNSLDFGQVTVGTHLLHSKFRSKPLVSAAWIYSMVGPSTQSALLNFPSQIRTVLPSNHAH